MASDEDLARIEALVEALKREYASDSNVRTVGWGVPRRAGELVDELAIVFYVRQKLGSERAIGGIGSRPIPTQIEGFPTDIVESNPRPVVDFAGQRDETMFDPLRGGIATSNATGHTYWFNEAGTLGILARDNTDASAVALSNWHVWAQDGDEGDDIIQPGHPTAGDHLEGVTKVAACGPLITSVIEWEWPSPLATGLYAGAAAAAIAAALSDYRDPTRRGQDNTPTFPAELTLAESTVVNIEYPQLPLPGTPFRTEVDWHYSRQTTQRVLEHHVEEDRVNTQFLLGKVVTTHKAHYQPGETVRLIAAIWDYQPRQCDAYHVVAHLIAHNHPDTALRVLLHPTTCPRNIPLWPPRDESAADVCVVFADYKEAPYPYKGRFAWLNYLNPAQHDVHIQDWIGGTPALVLPSDGISLSHAPAVAVRAVVAQFAGRSVELTAFDASGGAVGQAMSPPGSHTGAELSVTGAGIVSTTLRGGGGEAQLIRYCIDPVQEGAVEAIASPALVASLRDELPDLGRATRTRLAATRCCFVGETRVPPHEEAGKWDVYLTVQNINAVTDGTPPEEAAVVIGGHLLSQHSAPHVAGCVTTMLLDHAFDVI